MADTIPFRADPNKQDEPTKRPDDRVYTNEEVTEIIKFALQRSDRVERDSVTHEELIGIGRDFGLTEGDLDRAFDRMTQARVAEDRTDKAWLTFKVHFLLFGVINFGLFLINMLSDPTFWWVLYPVVSWGMLLALHGVFAKYLPSLLLGMLGAGWDYAQEQVYNAAAGSAGPNIASFKVELYDGLAEATGIARVEEGMLYLEYQTADGIFGFKLRAHELIVPIDDIVSAQLERGIWSNKLILHGQRLRTFEGFPGNKGNEVRLTFTGAARQASERLVRDLKAELRA